MPAPQPEATRQAARQVCTELEAELEEPGPSPELDAVLAQAAGDLLDFLRAFPDVTRAYLRSIAQPATTDVP